MTAHLVCEVTNSPPQADFGGDRTVECTSTAGASLTLDGAASDDAEGDIVSYVWRAGGRAGAVLGTGRTYDLDQALGAATIHLKAIDSHMQMGEVSATITVVDTTGPSIACNAPATITPSGTIYEFTASASDACGATPTAAQVIDYACTSQSGSGRPVTRDECAVQVSGGTLRILDSGGIGDTFTWRVRSTDDSGNTTTETCQTRVVRKK